MMRTSISFAVVTALAATACDGSLPTSSSRAAALSSGSAQYARSSALRPLMGSCTTTFNPAPLPPPPIHRQTDVGTCQLAHLGRTAYFGEQDINITAGTQSGWRRLTAANGDEIHATHAGTSSVIAPGRVSFVAQMTIVGGTGRFSGAAGSARVTGVATLATRSTSFNIDGVIRY